MLRSKGQIAGGGASRGESDRDRCLMREDRDRDTSCIKEDCSVESGVPRRDVEASRASETRASELRAVESGVPRRDVDACPSMESESEWQFIDVELVREAEVHLVARLGERAVRDGMIEGRVG